MSEPTTPPHESDPATGPVYTGPSEPSGPPPSQGAPSMQSAPPPTQAMAPQTVYVAQPPSRLNRIAAWVGIVAGSVFIVAVIFGTGFFVGKQVGHESRGGHGHGHGMMMRPGAAMFPMGPPGGFQRGPSFSGPFGPGGPMIEIPRSPQPPGAPGGSSTTTAPPRP